MNQNINWRNTLFSYLFTSQLIFFILSFFVVIKYFGENDGKNKYLFFLVLLALAVVMVFMQLNFRKQLVKEYYLDFLLVIFDIIIINILMFSTNIYEVKLLYLFPMIIMSIKYGFFASIVVIGLTILANSLLHIYLHNDPSLFFELDIFLLMVFVFISWAISKAIKIQDKIRYNLDKTEENLRKNKKLLENLVNKMPLVLIAVDKNEEIVLINESSIRIWGPEGRTASEFLGQKYQEYFKNFIDNVNYEESIIKDLLSGKKNFCQENKIYNNRIFELIGQAIKDEENTYIQYAMLIIKDVTKEEQIKEKLNHFDKMNMVGQMAASIAHEIKNPLTTIKGFLELSLKTKTNLDASQLNLLNEEVERCSNIATDFLSMTHKTKENKELVDLKKLIEQIAILIDKDASFNGVHLELELDNIAKLSLYKNQIKQLLLNLSRNSIEAMPDGGYLNISLREDEEWVCLSVKDKGEGIPNNVLEELSTPFVTTKKEGTGLGMTICQKIVDNHGAKMKIESSKEGTEILICFQKEKIL